MPPPPDRARDVRHAEARAERWRTFVAVPLSEGTRRRLAVLTAALRTRRGGDDVRWQRPETLHVTLRFLGDVDPGRVPALVRAVRAELAGIAPFEVSLGAPRLFPSLRRPRVVALPLAPEAPLAALAAAVERGVVAAGLPAERPHRPFRGHLTLGRLRPGAAPPDLPPDVTAPDTAAAEPLPVTEAVLFRSQLRRDGARHTPLERMPLAAPGGRDHP